MEAVNPTMSETATAAQNISSSSAAVAAAKRKTEWRVMLHVFVLLVALVPIAIYEFGVEPNRLGFFCDDHSIQMPIHDNTVGPVTLGLLVGPLPTLIIVFVEWMRHRHYNNLGGVKLGLCCCKMPAWLLTAFAICGHYFISLVFSFDVVEVAKFSIGRLRPHFLAICKPHLSNGTCADAHNQNRYIEDYTCTGMGVSWMNVRQARLSFPSGHASITFHAMVFLTLYLHKRVTWQSATLLRPLIQVTLITIAWFTALSRVMDYWHHWSDVLVGILIGVASALLYMWYVMRYFDSPSSHQQYKVSPHNNTLATLDEVYAASEQAIPPTYVTVGTKDFSNLV